MPAIVGLLIDSKLLDESITSESIFSKMANRLSHRGELTEFQYDLSDSKVHLGILNFDEKPDCVENQNQFQLLMIDKFGANYERVPKQIIDCLLNPKSRTGFPRATQMLVALGMTKEYQIRIFRSLDGVRPFYFTKLDYGYAFASELKAIWTIGVGEPETLDPGCTVSLAKGTHWEVTQVHSRELPETLSKIDFEEHLCSLRSCLQNSFLSLQQSGRCGVLFSGGVDSSLAALLTKEVNEDTLLITAATADSKDFEKTKETASVLSLEHKLIQFDEETVWENLPEVIYAIETSNRMNVEIAIPFFLAAMRAKVEGCKILVSGQGPDELFAGYARYERSFLQNGAESVREELWSDYSMTHKTNIARDVKAIEYHGLVSFFPYLDLDFSSAAFTTPVEFLLDPKSNPSRKIIFRDLAKKMGLPENIANAQKHATQYSSGSSKILQKAVTKYVKDAKDLSKKNTSLIVQQVLDTIAQEVGIPAHKKLETRLDLDMKPINMLLEKVGRLPTSNLG